MTTAERLREHLDEAYTLMSSEQVVGIFLQGSQNYGLDTPKSDVDSKLIIVPTLKDFALARKPISTTYIRDNEEHIDIKDVRLYLQCFRKQNINFLEILFTNYAIVNRAYSEQWQRLVNYRERIARLNPYRGVKAMVGMALEKYHAMEHEYPSKVEILKEYGYDPKQLHHLRRIEDFLKRYIAGERYEDCLYPGSLREELLEIKAGKYNLDEARELAESAIMHIRKMEEAFCNEVPNQEDREIVELLEDAQYEIIKTMVQGKV